MTPTSARSLRPPTAGGCRASGRPGGNPSRSRHAPTASPLQRVRPGARPSGQAKRLAPRLRGVFSPQGGSRASHAAILAIALACAGWASPGQGDIAHASRPTARPATTAANPAANPEATDYGVHVVRDGESLYAIARRYRMSVPELAALNGIRPSGFLLPGQGLRVPLTRAINARAGQPALAARDSDGESAVLGASSEGASATYLVQAGDTLYGIATRYGLDIEGLKARNGLPLDGAIRAGETLVLGDVTPQPRATDEAPTGGQPAQGGAGGEKSVTYVVQPGDTLTDIAGRYGATAQALRAMNGLSGDMISAGQRLSVPRQGSNQPLGYGAKRIEVDIGEQRMYVWEGDTLVYNWTVSTGLATHPTRRGTFAVQSKIPNAWSSPWQLWMPNWLGIYWAGGSENGIHALPIINGTRIWGGYLGSPISYGCVVLDTYASQLLYTWAEIGTPVDIHD